jgi:hypothetical protein
MCFTFGTRRQTRRVGSWLGALQGVPAGLSDARWGADTQSEQTNDHGGGDDDGVGGHRAARTPTASNGCTSTVTIRTGSLTTTTDHTGGPSGGRRCRSASVALSCGTPATASRATTPTPPTKVDPGSPCGAKIGHRKLHRGTKAEVRTCHTRKSRKRWVPDFPAQSRSASVSRELTSASSSIGWKQIGVVTRHCRPGAS